MSQPRRVCVVTGSRAEYGLLQWVMKEIKERQSLSLQLVVTGTHLAPSFGATEWEIVEDGFRIDRRVEITMGSDSPVAVAKSHAMAVAGIAEVLRDLRPDVVLLLGDRFEIHAAAVATLISRIPLAHIHGGEVTTGSIDDQFRHSITKMANLHLVAHETYRRRVIQLGEHPDTIRMVGGLGYESARRRPLMSKGEVEERLGMKLRERNILVVFHPETTSHDSGLGALRALCDALGRLDDCGLVVSPPNADVGGGLLRTQLASFVSCQPHAVCVESMGQQLYLSCLNQMSAIVGNSSSGLLEAPALGVPTLDIGNRQTGRIRPSSVIHVKGNRREIQEALSHLWSPAHLAASTVTRESLAELRTSSLICDALESLPMAPKFPKQFVDIPLESAPL